MHTAALCAPIWVDYDELLPVPASLTLLQGWFVIRNCEPNKPLLSFSCFCKDILLQQLQQPTSLVTSPSGATQQSLGTHLSKMGPWTEPGSGGKGSTLWAHIGSYWSRQVYLLCDKSNSDIAGHLLTCVIFFLKIRSSGWARQ